MSSPLLTPISALYGGLMSLRSHLYKKKWFKEVQLDVPVLSVGNVTVGGTGKTPVVDALLRVAELKKDRVAVISRNYRAQCTRAEQISERKDGSNYFGDEPYWLFKRHPHADFYVGPSKSETARELVKLKSYDLVIIDDGFQHLALKRDFDLVLIDATTPESDYHLLPVGRAREPISSVFERGDFVFLTKCNLAEDKNLQFWRQRLKGKVEFTEISYVIRRVENMSTGELLTGNHQEVLAFCGLAQPSSFIQGVEVLTNAQVEAVLFSDHYGYTKLDIDQVIQRANGRPIITTEKDAIKLAPLNIDHSKIWVSKLEISSFDSIELVYEKAKRSFG